jgi:hypothetical protein
MAIDNDEYADKVYAVGDDRYVHPYNTKSFELLLSRYTFLDEYDEDRIYTVGDAYIILNKIACAEISQVKPYNECIDTSTYTFKRIPKHILLSERCISAMWEYIRNNNPTNDILMALFIHDLLYSKQTPSIPYGVDNEIAQLLINTNSELCCNHKPRVYFEQLSRLYPVLKKYSEVDSINIHDMFMTLVYSILSKTDEYRDYIDADIDMFISFPDKKILRMCEILTFKSAIEMYTDQMYLCWFACRLMQGEEDLGDCIECASEIGGTDMLYAMDELRCCDEECQKVKPKQ